MWTFLCVYWIYLLRFSKSACTNISKEINANKTRKERKGGQAYITVEILLVCLNNEISVQGKWHFVNWVLAEVLFK